MGNRILHLVVSTASTIAWILMMAGCQQRTSLSGPLPSADTTSVPLPSADRTHVFDLTGAAVNPLEDDGATAKVFLFTRADCPISNRYAPEVRRIMDQFTAQGVEFFLVYPDPDQTAEGIRQHMSDYGYECGALRDPHHALVKRAGARITPEAAVFVPGGQMVYRGRINDRYVAFGKARAEATSHDLQNALEAVLAGHPIDPATTEAVGCYIADLK